MTNGFFSCIIPFVRRKLRGTPYAHGVNEAVADDLCAGYDIQSCDLDGSPVFIEVKTTNGDVSEPMHMSANELEFAEYCYANDLRYGLHRVYHLHNNRFPLPALFLPRNKSLASRGNLRITFSGGAEAWR